MSSQQDIATLLNQLERHLLQQVLENHGYGVYERETAEQLREAVRQDVESGEIDLAEIETLLDQRSASPGL